MFFQKHLRFVDSFVSVRSKRFQKKKQAASYMAEYASEGI